MADIVERLRDIAMIPDPITTAREAADEIERARERLFHARNMALEEAAQVAETSASWRPEVVSAAIRALKGGA